MIGFNYFRMSVNVYHLAFLIASVLFITIHSSCEMFRYRLVPTFVKMPRPRLPTNLLYILVIITESVLGSQSDLKTCMRFIAVTIKVTGCKATTLQPVLYFFEAIVHLPVLNKGCSVPVFVMIKFRS